MAVQTHKMRHSDRDPAWLPGCSQPKCKIWPWSQGNIRPTQTQGPFWNHCLMLLKLSQVTESKDKTKELWRCDSCLHAILGQSFYFCFVTADKCWPGLWGWWVDGLSWWHPPGSAVVRSPCLSPGSVRWNVEEFEILLFSCFQLWHVSLAFYIKSFLKIKTSNLILINKTKTELIKLS